ncbi:MAG TPA: STAS domain-containing protein [Candidatus Limnocylindrales bacterium]|nr:STAS domain-containing protein [Candidatus Limnocylindrales bacterium]
MTESRRRTPVEDVVLILRPPVVPADAASLCELACPKAAPRSGRVLLDVGDLPGGDLRTVDLLARLSVEVRRSGRRVELRDAPAELRQLLALLGLARVIPSEGPPLSRRGASAARIAGRTSPCRGRT